MNVGCVVRFLLGEATLATCGWVGALASLSNERPMLAETSEVLHGDLLIFWHHGILASSLVPKLSVATVAFASVVASWREHLLHFLGLVGVKVQPWASHRCLLCGFWFTSCMKYVGWVLVWVGKFIHLEERHSARGIGLKLDLFLNSLELELTVAQELRVRK